MVIGWLKLTMSMEIDFNNACNGFGEERPMLFRNILARGHSLILLSNLKKQDSKLLLKSKTDGVDNQIVNNGWFGGIQYDPHCSVTDLSKLDALVVENGPLNMTFMDSHTKQPHIRKVVDIINKFEGLVIFYQSDPLLPFPFWRLTMAERPWSHTDNNVRNKRPAVEEDGWADYNEIFKNKKILCLGKAENVEQYPYAMDSNRFNYPYFKDHNLIDFDFMATGYDPYFLPHIKKNNFDDKLFDLSYVGYPRSRVSYFKKFYGRNLNRTHTVGPWDIDKLKKKDLEKFREKGMKWYGYVNGFIEVTQFYNESKFCINLLPRKGQQLGWISNRMFESVHCGCITYGDKDTYAIEKYVPKELILDLDDKDAVNTSIENALNMNKQQFEDLLDKQFKMIEHINYQYVIERFENLVKKYSSKTKV